MLFSDLAIILEKISGISARNEMTQVLGDCFKQLTPAEAKVVAYLVLGEVGPTYAGLQFNMAEKALLKSLATMYAKPSREVLDLMAKLGDVGLVVEVLNLGHHWQNDFLFSSEPIDTSVLGIHSFLMQLQAISGSGSQERKELALARVMPTLDGLSLKFLLRIIVGDLRLGFSDMTLLDAFSFASTGDKSLRPALERAYNACVDVGMLIQVLKQQGLEGIDNISITPGIPVRPAAAERLADAQAIVDKLGSCIAQPKLDGFRLQVHLIKQADGSCQVHFFSRNLQDMSAMFPDLRQLVCELDVQSCIFEGEAIAFDASTGVFLPFQETVKRKRKHGVDEAASEFPLKLYAFDLLYLNGAPLLDKTHAERRAIMVALLKNLSDEAQQYVQAIEEVPVDSGPALENYFYQNITQGLEGLVVKRQDAIYTPGKRNFNWIKLKRQETGSLEDTIDCVILGYYKGSGKRAKFGIGALLVGIYDAEADLFQTVAKIGTGLSDEEWVAMRVACDALVVDHWTSNVACNKELMPDVFVRPAKVCMIRADEITFSPAHKAADRLLQRGLALRFPRYMGDRPDKAATDATTARELVGLFERQKVRKSA